MFTIKIQIGGKMHQQEIADFFAKRKEDWLKKKQKASMGDDAIFELRLECEKTFSLEEWLPKAAKRAGQISMSTHPCTFSHPSARKNKNGYVTPVISNGKRTNDGYLRSGNVQVETDALGNAAVLDVYKFLTLTMDDGVALIEHIKKDSDIARSLLHIKAQSYETLKNGFMEMIGSSDEVVTSSKIKQVYFPIESDQYHLLSVLTNSGILFHMRHTIDRLRFGDEVKALREMKRVNKASETGFMEIYDITTIGFGGTKPQNISVLNNQNGGKAHLLSSMPPVIRKREVRFPKRNFFGESVRAWELRETFTALDKIFKTGYNNKNIREGRDYRYEQIIDTIMLKLYRVREAAEEQYFEKSSQLKSHQRIWLLDEKRRLDEDEWLEKLLKEITAWFVRSFEEIVGKKIIVYGKAEKQNFADLLETYKEALR